MRIPALTSALRRLPARPPRFSLRSLLAVITVVSLSLGWYVPRVQTERRAAEAIRAAGGNAIYDWQIRPDDCPLDYKPDPPGPYFLRAWLGPHWFDSIAAVVLADNRVLLADNRLPNGKYRFEFVGPHLLRLDKLQGLWLSMSRLDDECYRTIGRLRNLEELTLRLRNELTPENAAEIAKVRSLRKLCLLKAHVTADALRELSRLPNLVELEITCDRRYPPTGEVIDEFRLRDDAAEAIGEFRNLQTLMLFETRITDAGLAHLCRNSQLERLVASSPLATSESFAEVAKLNRLRHLGTWGWTIDNADFEQLAVLPRLESLGLVTRSVTDESVPNIVRLPYIKKLQFTGEGITDASLPHFQRIPALEWLDLDHTAVNKLSQAAIDLRTALPNCRCLLPRTPKEEARHRAFIDSKYNLGRTTLINFGTNKPPTTQRKD